MTRQVILDTETTGLRIEDGHRIIEIGCLEMINRKLTGKSFHHYINPGRVVEPGALAVHGITNDFLANKPVFDDIANELMEFISGAELIIHNAPFDIGFLNNELAFIGKGWNLITDYCHVIDTLQIARQLHAGQRNSLDALCKRYAVDNSKRDLHGALLDAHLLAQVYLIMTGGQGSFFDVLTKNQTNHINKPNTAPSDLNIKYQLTILYADTEEQQQHQDYLALLSNKGTELF